MFKQLFAWEVTLERPRWMRIWPVEKRDLEIHERYRVPEEFFRDYRKAASPSTGAE